MRIDGERIYLRPLDEGDCTETYVAWLNDPAVNRFLETRHSPQTLESVREYVRGVNVRDGEHLFGIFMKPSDRHIGNIKVGPVHPRHAVADVSLFIGARDQWGKGYAADAIAALSRHAFGSLGVQKLSASMYRDNESSQRAFIKVGYRREGERRAHYVLDGQRSDIIDYGLIPDDLALA
jgi:RimJ/RimL family protein N-acetyltransferase